MGVFPCIGKCVVGGNHIVALFKEHFIVFTDVGYGGGEAGVVAAFFFNYFRVFFEFFPYYP